MEKMLKRMVAAVAAQGAGEDQPLCPSRQCLCGGDLAVGLVLGRRERMSLDLRPCLDERRRRGVEIPHPELRLHAQRLRMPHAAVGRDEAASGNRMLQSIGEGQIPAEQDGECGLDHGKPISQSRG